MTCTPGQSACTLGQNAHASLVTVLTMGCIPFSCVAQTCLTKFVPHSDLPLESQIAELLDYDFCRLEVPGIELQGCAFKISAFSIKFIFNSLSS